MERKVKGFILLLSLLFVVTLFFKLDSGKVGMVSDFSITEEEYQAITSNKKKIENPRILNIKIDQYTLPYDPEEDFYLYTIEPSKFDLQHMDIDIAANQNFNYEIGFIDKEINESTLQNNEPLELLVYTEEHYAIYNIYLTTLPIAQIELDYPGSREYPIGPSRQKGKLKIFTNDSTIEVEQQNIESDLYINLRGASSRAFPKNQYRIHLREFTIGGDEKNRHESLLALRKDDDYILYAPYNDPEKARNIFANNLWFETMATNNRFNVNNGIEGEYVELFIDGQYWGLYALTHPLDNKQVALESSVNPEESEFYYRSVTNEPFDFAVFENSLGTETALGRFELRENDEPLGDPQQWKAIYEHFKMIKQSDAMTLKNYLENHTDIENQIDYYLFIIFLQASDNHYKNHNYISKLDGDTRVMLESPWDLDLTLGLRWDGTHMLQSYIHYQPEWNLQALKTLVYRAKLLGVEGIDEQVINRYQELRTNHWSNEAIQKMLNDFEFDIYQSGAIKRDKQRWPDTAYNESFNEFRNYVMQRLEAMDQFILEESR